MHDRRPVPPQRSCLTDAQDLGAMLTRLSDNVEQAMAFADECARKAPELAPQAQALTEQAMELFKATVRSLRTQQQDLVTLGRRC